MTYYCENCNIEVRHHHRLCENCAELEERTYQEGTAFMDELLDNVRDFVRQELDVEWEIGKTKVSIPDGSGLVICKNGNKIRKFQIKVELQESEQF